jgi:hypothetical protein
MKRFNILFILFFAIFHTVLLSGVATHIPLSSIGRPSEQDTLKDYQVLYNGKIWRDLYYQVHENQFLFSDEFLSGSLSISGKVFNNIDLKYDIFKDELLTPVENGNMLQLNKEMVDSFTLNFQNKNYRFIRMKEGPGPGGYFNVLYKRKSALYLKYYKKIDKLAVEGQYDMFYQDSKLFFVNDSAFFQITGKRDLINAIDDKNDRVKTFIKKNKFNVSEKIPESFIPILRYFDGLSQ